MASRSRWKYVSDPIQSLVAQHTNMQVQSGPFSGMKMSPRVCWSELDRPAKLLGTYEQDLQPFLLKYRQRDHRCVIDIGCAEGFYAVGLALLYKYSTVFAFDTNIEAQEIVEENADLNGVSNRVVVGGLCDGKMLINKAREHESMFVFCDCEGNERSLFSDDATRASLSKSDLIIECHEFMDAGVTKYLRDALSSSHRVFDVYDGPRNPNAFRFLESVSDQDRWRAICEYRPCRMNWLVCESL